MSDFKCEVLVIGLGNVLMSDDGFGVYVVDELKKKDWPPEVSILEVGTSVVCYLEEISQSRSVIAVDAVRAGGKSGSVYRLVCGDIMNLPDDRRDAHGFLLPDVIKLARGTTGFPVNLIIFGMEPLDLGFGNQLSPVARKSLPEVIDAVAKEIENLLAHAPEDGSP